MKAFGLILFLHLLSAGMPAQALLSTEILPADINSPSFRMGSIDKVDERYTENGTLMKLGDVRSVVFDAETLAQFNPEAKKLISALNRFGNLNLGDNFSLGVLRVDTRPVVKYFAPVFARGLTKHWTLGVGLPIINYQNKITLSQQFSNLDYYRSQFSGLDPELDTALNTDLTASTRQTLRDRGYKALENRDETFLGDVQIASIYKVFETPAQALIYQAQLSLPTGPRYDSDDLAALNIFGRTNLNNTFAFSQKWGRASFVPYISYVINIPDQITMRVPRDENDTLPDQATKEDIMRHLGATLTTGGNIFYELSDSWKIGSGFESAQKGSDSYQGTKNSRYELLTKGTDLQAQRVKAEIAYSSVSSYFKKESTVPMVVALEISDVISGSNVERQLVQELNFIMFF